MNFKEFLMNLWQSQRALLAAGLGFVVLTAVLSIAALFDSQLILGINRWIKPLKFAGSIAIFLWTLAVYLYFLRGYAKSARVIAWGASAAMIGEIILITMQAARGTTSHFNVETTFDATVFAAMGMLIAFNTALMIYLAYLYFRAEFALPKAVIWGMRLGLVIFLLASFEGGYMSAQLSHSVGVAADGGAGLPFVNWSTEGGDLRAAHFVGMHAFQAIPLLAALLVFLQKRFSAVRATTVTVAFSLLYLAIFAAVFVQARRGKPLLGKQVTVSRQQIDDR